MAAFFEADQPGWAWHDVMLQLLDVSFLLSCNLCSSQRQKLIPAEMAGRLAALIALTLAASIW